MRLFGITSPEALRQVDRKVIMAYERHLREVQRLRAYLAAAGHGQHRDGPLFRRLNWSGSEQDRRRPLRPERVEWVVRKYTQQIGLGHGYSSHSMRTTFITTALQNGAKLDDVQRTVGHADPNVFMTGIHVGCYELFAAQPVRTIHDLKGQRVAVTELDAGPHFLFARTLWYVDLDPAKSFSLELAD
jgi:hypothetical protein